MRMRSLLVGGLLFGALLVPTVARAQTNHNRPGATLLLPYFEVDLDHPAGVTTLFSINNASATAVLAQAFGGELEPYARKHWSGSEDLRVVIQDVTSTAQSLLGKNLYDRLRRLMSRRGIELDDAE